MKRHKYGAVQVERDGHKFPSKAEARYYDLLKARQEAGEIVGFTRQVPLHFPGGSRLTVDFQVFFNDGTHRFVEVKGRETTDWKLRLSLFEQFYPWADLEIVNASEV